MINWQKYPVHAVTGDELALSPGFFELAAQVAGTGLAAINLRAHGLSGRRLYEIALQLREITGRFGTPLVVNGRPDIALAVGADSVQLGANTVPLEAAARLCRERDLQFGVSCHSQDEALAAQAAGASYLYLGTVFSSASKPGVVPCGAGFLAKITKTVDIPVVAIGGIEPGNVAQAAASGAAAAAAITSVWKALSPADAVRELGAHFGRQV
jgi:thiamine-phosphate pyrophosphorylase